VVRRQFGHRESVLEAHWKRADGAAAQARRNVGGQRFGQLELAQRRLDRQSVAVVLGLNGPAGPSTPRYSACSLVSSVSLTPSLSEVQAGDLLVEVLRQHVDPDVVLLVGLVNSSIWAITWLENEFDITKLGWPVALPRFIRRPSDSTMTPWPSGKTSNVGRAPAA
jgi:hypothetical protein